MNKTDKIVNLIRDYKEIVKEGVLNLNRKQADHPSFYKEIDENGFFKQSGYLDDEKKIQYKFHGPLGCLIKWADGKIVDFDLGEEGRCDGFDLGFVKSFYDDNEEIKRKYQAITFEDIEEVVNALVQEGIIVHNKLDRLFYFKKDYDNLTPFKWIGEL